MEYVFLLVSKKRIPCAIFCRKCPIKFVWYFGRMGFQQCNTLRWWHRSGWLVVFPRNIFFLFFFLYFFYIYLHVLNFHSNGIILYCLLISSKKYFYGQSVFREQAHGDSIFSADGTSEDKHWCGRSENIFWDRIKKSMKYMNMNRIVCL